MQVDIGHFALALAWLVSIWGLVSSLYGALESRKTYAESGMNALAGSFLLLTVCVICLGVAFVYGDFRYLYVWQHSNQQMGVAYRIAAIWGGMDGSMMFWAFCLVAYGALAVYQIKEVSHELRAWMVFYLNLSTSYFISIVLFLTNPFKFVPVNYMPKDGSELNPLLQNPSMLLHPPILYLGFTGMVVPFAAALAAVSSGQVDSKWLKAIRSWVIIAWLFLTAGIILGGNWAYIELGWGGFWAWDPVENASFIPWLIATAFLHSAIVQEHREMLRAWNIILGSGTYLLAVFGTFITRSGVVQSVHSFASSKIGWVFLAFIGSCSLLLIILLFIRRRKLRPQERLQGLFCRETTFVLNNLLLCSLAFIVVWGVLFPVLSDFFIGKKVVVGPPFFNTATGPLFLAILFLMALSPLISWKQGNWKRFFSSALFPFLLGSTCTSILLYRDRSSWLLSVAVGIGVLAVSSSLIELSRSLRRLDPLDGSSSLLNKICMRRRKIGGMVAHAGAGIFALAAILSSAWKIERDVTIAPGESLNIAHYQITLTEVTEVLGKNYQAWKALVRVSDTGRPDILPWEMSPEFRFYPLSEQSTSEVAIHMTPLDDLYLAFAGLDVSQSEEYKPESSKVIFKMFVNPFQVWLWVGSFIMILGGLICLLPKPKAAISSLVSAPSEVSSLGETKAANGDS